MGLCAYVWFALFVTLGNSCFAKLVEEDEPVVQVWCDESLRNLIENKLEDLNRKIDLLDLKLSTKTTFATTTENKAPENLKEIIAKSVEEYHTQMILEQISRNIQNIQQNQKEILTQIGALNHTISSQPTGNPNLNTPIEKPQENATILEWRLMNANHQKTIDEILKLNINIRMLTVSESTHHDEVIKNARENKKEIITVFEEFQKKSQQTFFDYIDDSFKNLQCLKSQEKLDPKNSNLVSKPENLNETSTVSFENCDDAIKRFGASGVYSIHLPETTLAPFEAFCLADPKNGTGWTIIQRRQDGSVDFYRNWQSYKKGFGQLDGEYWLGLEKIYAMTSKKPHELWIKLIDYGNKEANAFYTFFEIGNETDAYYLKTVGKYSGYAGDSLGTGNLTRKFTTLDADNDADIDRNCAVRFKGAWWYDSCNWSDLNGQYKSKASGMGINWISWHGYEYSMKYVHMAIRATE